VDFGEDVLGGRIDVDAAKREFASAESHHLAAAGFREFDGDGGVEITETQFW